MMDIYITGKNAKGANQKIQLPVIPEEIETSLDGKFAEYDISVVVIDATNCRSTFRMVKTCQSLVGIVSCPENQEKA